VRRKLPRAAQDCARTRRLSPVPCRGRAQSDPSSGQMEMQASAMAGRNRMNGVLSLLQPLRAKRDLAQRLTVRIENDLLPRSGHFSMSGIALAARRTRWDRVLGRPTESGELSGQAPRKRSESRAYRRGLDLARER